MAKVLRIWLGFGLAMQIKWVSEKSLSCEFTQVLSGNTPAEGIYIYPQGFSL